MGIFIRKICCLEQTHGDYHSDKLESQTSKCANVWSFKPHHLQITLVSGVLLHQVLPQHGVHSTCTPSIDCVV